MLLDKIKHIKRKLAIRLVLKSILMIYIFCAVVSSVALLLHFSLHPWIWAIIIVHVTAFSILYYKLTHLSTQSVIRYLENKYPELERSLFLVLKPDSQLTAIEQLQMQKLNHFFNQNNTITITITFHKALVLCVVSTVILAFTSFYYDPYHLQSAKEEGHAVPQEEKHADDVQNDENDKQISFTLSSVIYPPAYTRLRSFRLSKNQSIPEGSLIKMNYTFSDSVEHFQVRHNNSGKTTDYSPSRLFTYKEQLFESSLHNISFSYQNATYSPEPLLLNVLKDKKPQVELSNESAVFRTYHYDQIPPPLKIKVADDYGVIALYAYTTLSRGQGENVRFREKKYELYDSDIGKENIIIDWKMDWDSLQMRPGDELYVYFVARDNKKPIAQTHKTETYFLSIKDTAEHSSGDIGGIAMDIMPEYFRSQRQIIIDTEKLINNKKTMSKREFMTESNEIGVDQKILRLRYGQFLGEEYESGIALDVMHELEHQHNHEHHEGEDHDHSHSDELAGVHPFASSQHDHSHEESAGNATLDNPWMESYVHAHDSRETATFFDEAIKSQLKAALNNMWQAELHLRMGAPDQALPYEYEALQLIKAVQQKSRIYVERVGFEAPAINISQKRLSGNLSAVNKSILTKEDIVLLPKWTSLIELTRLLAQDSEAIPDALVSEALDELTHFFVSEGVSNIALLADLQQMTAMHDEPYFKERLALRLTIFLQRQNLPANYGGMEVPTSVISKRFVTRKEASAND